MPPPTPFLAVFYFTKAKFTSKKLVLNEYEIYLKMLEMAILETKIFKISDPLESSHLWHLLVLPTAPFENPGSTPVMYC